MKIDHSAHKGSIDRRVARTRALLQEALVALIPRRGYSAITVEDICAEGNVGRSTFYSHYTGKDELRRATIDAHLRSLSERQAAQAAADRQRYFELSLPMFEHAHAFRTLHHALLSSAGDMIHDEIRNRIRHSVRQELNGKRIGDEVTVEFVAGAFLSVLAWWIGTGAKLSPIEIDDRFQQLALRGLEKAAAIEPA